MIRATRGGLLDRVGTQLATTSSRLQTAEEQATTGLKLNHPSDAPASVREAERLHAAVASQGVWQSNADAATSVLDTMDGALGRVSDVLVRARELAVAASSETASSDSRALCAIEVQGLIGSLRDAANTQYAGRYVFSGTQTGTAPFDDTNTYQGDTSVPQTRIGEDRWVSTGMDGSAVFTGTADVFGTLTALQTALTADDPTAVSATLTDLDSAATSISASRADVGSDTNNAEDASEVASSLSTLLDTRLNQLVAVDPAEAYSQLTSLRNTYQATLQVAGSATNRTLFDLLG